MVASHWAPVTGAWVCAFCKEPHNGHYLLVGGPHRKAEIACLGCVGLACDCPEALERDLGALANPGKPVRE